MSHRWWTRMSLQRWCASRQWTQLLPTEKTSRGRYGCAVPVHGTSSNYCSGTCADRFFDINCRGVSLLPHLALCSIVSPSCKLCDLSLDVGLKNRRPSSPGPPWSNCSGIHQALPSMASPGTTWCSLYRCVALRCHESFTCKLIGVYSPMPCIVVYSPGATKLDTAKWE
jgi:hypothetical protein